MTRSTSANCATCSGLGSGSRARVRVRVRVRARARIRVRVRLRVTWSLAGDLKVAKVTGREGSRVRVCWKRCLK